jgi:hypothetical protein
MNEYDVNACMKAFTKLCEEAERSELVEMMEIINAGKVEKLALATAASTIGRLALH